MTFRREAPTSRAAPPARAFTFDSFVSYNHVTNSGFQYDANGNMTHDASHSYTYDEENRLSAVDAGSTASYLYDPEGHRVQKVAGGVTTDYIRDLAGNVVAEVSSTCNYCWTVGYNYLGGRLSSMYTNSTTYFVHTDHLGSTRLLTGYPTASVVECDDYYPFGEQVSCGGTSTTTHKFTGGVYPERSRGKRDAESGLDNAQARYNSSSLGRFMSPDPIGTDPGACEWSNAAACEADNNLGDFGNWEDFSGAGFGTSYTMDGVGVPAGVATAALDSGAAVECPNDARSGFGTDANGNTKYVQFYAFAGGVNGYFNPGDLANGINEVNGRIYTDAGFAQLEQAAIDQQRRNLAIAIAAATGQDPALVYGQLAYRNTKGGNANFTYPGGSSLFPGCIGGGEGPACRSGGLPSIHYPGEATGVAILHLDAGNPFSSFPFGVLAHLGDLSGEINSSVPFGTPGP